jgi:hypothetical protein
MVGKHGDMIPIHGTPRGCSARRESLVSETKPGAPGECLRPGRRLTYKLSDELCDEFADGLASDSHADVRKNRLACFSSAAPTGLGGWLGCGPRTALRLSWAIFRRPYGTRPMVRRSLVLGWDRCRGLRFGVCGIPGPQKRGTGAPGRLSTVHRPLSTEKRRTIAVVWR